MSDEYIKKEERSRTFTEIADDLNDLVSELNDKIVELVKSQSADVAPVRHGRWSKAKDNQGYTIEEEEYDFFYVCSACGRWTIGARNYCPNCGAKMDEGEDNED